MDEAIKKDKSLMIRIDKETKKKLKVFVKKNGTDNSKFVRELICKAIDPLHAEERAKNHVLESTLLQGVFLFPVESGQKNIYSVGENEMMISNEDKEVLEITASLLPKSPPLKPGGDISVKEICKDLTQEELDYVYSQYVDLHKGTMRKE